MNINKIIQRKNPSKESLEKIKVFLDKCCHIYYNTDEQSPLTDEEFDKLHKWYTQFESYSTTTAPASGKRLVDVSHMYPELVGTLDKAYSIEEVEDWFNSKGISDKLVFSIAVSYKEDGNSICLTYSKEGKLESALTRGKDGKGADMTKYFKHITLTMPNNKSPFGVKCEAIMTNEDFEEYNKIYETLNGKRLANSRSAVAGILGSDEGYKYSKFVKIVPLSISFLKGHVTREQQLRIIDCINNLSNDIVPMQYKIFKGTKSEIIEKLRDYYNYVITEKRDRLNRPIDGLVIEFVNDKIREKLGREDDRNKFDIALKFPYIEKKSKVVDVEFYMGKTNRVTPVLHFEDLEFNGAICNRVSLANYKRFKELDLHVGDEVLIQYRGDVLSYCHSKTKDNGGEKIKFISKCPICNEKLSINKNKTFVFCKNPDCGNLNKGKIENWLTKIGVKGIKNSTIDKIVEAGYLNKISDLYSLKEEDLVKIDTFQEKLASNVIKAIWKVNTIYDYELIGSLMIEQFGRKSAKLLCRKYNLVEIFTLLKNKKLKDEIIKIDGFSDITADYIVKGLISNFEEIKKLNKILTIKESKLKDTNVKALTFVFTGYRDKAVQEKLESMGHSVTGSVSSKTNYLVTKDINSTSSKVKKAKELGVTILTPDQLKDLMKL